jgi:hypothetical protein
VEQPLDGTASDVLPHDVAEAARRLAFFRAAREQVKATETGVHDELEPVTPRAAPDVEDEPMPVRLVNPFDLAALEPGRQVLDDSLDFGRG